MPVDTLLYWSTAAGVEIIWEDNTGSPEIAIAKEIAPAVPLINAINADSVQDTP